MPKIGLLPKAILAEVLAACVGLVHLYIPKQLAPILLHGLTDPVVHEPSGLLGYAYLLRKLYGANAFLACCEEVNGDEPFSKRELGLPKKGSGLDGEILLAGGAAIPLSVLEAVNLLVATVWAEIAIQEPNGLEIGSALLLSRESVYECSKVFECHA